MAQFECRNKSQNGARMWLVCGALQRDRSVVFPLAGLVVDVCRGARQVPMNSVPMEVPFLAGTVCMEIHHRFVGGGIGRIACYVRGEVIERRSR